MVKSSITRAALLVLFLVIPIASHAQQALTPQQVETTIVNRVPSQLSYVPGQLIVKMRDDAPIAANVLTTLGLDTNSNTLSGGEFLYTIPTTVTASMTTQAVMDNTRAIKDQLEARDDVEYVQYNYIYNIVSHPSLSVAPAAIPATPADPRYNEQWHYFNNGTGAGESPGGINLPDAWDTTTGSRDIVVAVLDTGILPDEEDANAANLVAGYDFVSNTFQGNDGDGRDGDATDPGDAVSAGECAAVGFPSNPAMQDSWHGTHVAGTIGYGTTNNDLGIAGINWEVSVQPVRVLGKCGGSTADIADAIRWAAGLPVSGVPDNQTPAHVINMSLGGQGSCAIQAAFQNAINDAVAAGTAVVVAAGNSSADASGFTPAGCTGVITVAASDASGRLVDRYSNYGSTVEIMAPGGNTQNDDDNNGFPDGVLSITGRGYEYYNGTSMASPHVAGALALWLADDPSLTPEQLLTRLEGTAIPRGSVECSRPCGAGLLNANSFVQPPPMRRLALSLNPDQSIGNGGQTDAIATVTFGGSAEPGVDVTFTIADTAKVKFVSSPTSKSVTITSNASGLAVARLEGVDNSGNTTLTATAGTASAQVTVEVPDLAFLGIALALSLIFFIEYRRRQKAKLVA